MEVWINTGFGGGGVPNLVGWYYHFATELIMGPTSVLSAIRQERGAVGHHPTEGRYSLGPAEGDRLADHLLIPGVDWKDQYGLNEILVEGTFKRESEFVDRSTWERWQDGGKRWVLFDRGTPFPSLLFRSHISSRYKDYSDELS
jgi:hypothetical protein